MARPCIAKRRMMLKWFQGEYLESLGGSTSDLHMQMPVSTLRDAGCCCRLWGNEEQLVTVWGSPWNMGKPPRKVPKQRRTQ